MRRGWSMSWSPIPYSASITGSATRKSMIPMGLKMYLIRFLAMAIRRKYSSTKKSLKEKSYQLSTLALNGEIILNSGMASSVNEMSHKKMAIRMTVSHSPKQA